MKKVKEVSHSLVGNEAHWMRRASPEEPQCACKRPGLWHFTLKQCLPKPSVVVFSSFSFLASTLGTANLSAPSWLTKRDSWDGDGSKRWQLTVPSPTTPAIYSSLLYSFLFSHCTKPIISNWLLIPFIKSYLLDGFSLEKREPNSQWDSLSHELMDAQRKRQANSFHLDNFLLVIPVWH